VPLISSGARAWLLGILGAIAGVVLWLSFAFSPAEVSAGAIQGALGLERSDCPGCALCGLSRAFSLASHGEWRGAGELNKLFFLAYSFTWLMALSGLWVVSRHLWVRKGKGNHS
jgi:hypothetical protein